MLEHGLTTQGEVIGWFTGDVDEVAGDEARALVRASGQGRVILDFSRARNVDYYGLTALAAELSRGNAAVVLRGLSETQVRMLRYLGLDPRKLGIRRRVPAEFA